MITYRQESTGWPDKFLHDPGHFPSPVGCTEQAWSSFKSSLPPTTIVKPHLQVSAPIIPHGEEHLCSDRCRCLANLAELGPRYSVKVPMYPLPIPEASWSVSVRGQRDEREADFSRMIQKAVSMGRPKTLRHCSNNERELEDELHFGKVQY